MVRKLEGMRSVRKSKDRMKRIVSVRGRKMVAEVGSMVSVQLITLLLGVGGVLVDMLGWEWA